MSTTITHPSGVPSGDEIRRRDRIVEAAVERGGIPRNQAAGWRARLDDPALTDSVEGELAASAMSRPADMLRVSAATPPATPPSLGRALRTVPGRNQ